MLPPAALLDLQRVLGPRATDGRYEVSANLALRLPADRKIQLAVDVLCARDTAGNESCVLPVR